MRHPQLHAALRSAGQHAARELAARVREGDEVPFELLEHAHRSRSSASRPTLYSYRPLVGLYVERHAETLAALPAVAEAEHTMVAAWGVEAYLEARGVERPPADPHARAALAVRQFLERLFEDAPDFVPTEEHFARAFAELDAVLTNDATETVVAIPLVGVEPTMSTVAITRGVALQRPEALRGEVPDAALVGPDGTPADAVATLRWSARPGSAATPTRAREASRRLVTALRLHVAGAVPSAGPLVWIRASGSAWRAMAIGGTFASRGVAPIAAQDVADLRTFVDLVARRLPEQGEVAWALRRWTLALDRDRPEETLSDLLLAGRALLEPEGPRSGRLAGRLAALCATGEERTRLAGRLARLALQEQEVIAGSRRIDRDLPAHVDELGECLRAVLRDCVVGHLRGDLVEIAEGLLEDGVAVPGPQLAGWPSERLAGTMPDVPAAPTFVARDEDFEDAAGSAFRVPPPALPDVRPARAGERPAPTGPARRTTPTGRTPEGLDVPVPEYAPPAPAPQPTGRAAKLRPLDPTGPIRAGRLRPAAPRDLWLDVTWDAPQMTDRDDDDEPGPWPVSEAS
jgi:hypothetical protein